MSDLMNLYISDWRINNRNNLSSFKYLNDKDKKEYERPNYVLTDSWIVGFCLYI